MIGKKNKKMIKEILLKGQTQNSLKELEVKSPNLIKNTNPYLLITEKEKESKGRVEKRLERNYNRQKYWKPKKNMTDYKYVKSKWLLELMAGKKVNINKKYGYIFNSQIWMNYLYGKKIQDRLYTSTLSRG